MVYKVILERVQAHAWALELGAPMLPNRLAASAQAPLQGEPCANSRCSSQPREPKRALVPDCEWARKLHNGQGWPTHFKRRKYFDYAACFTASIKVGSLLSAFELLTRLETAHRCK